MKWWKKLCAAALALSMPVLASAEAKLVDTQTFARSITLGRASDTYVTREDWRDTLRAMDGTALSESYADISAQEKGLYYEVANENGANQTGLMDAAGTLLIPMAYSDFTYVGNGWVVAVTLEETTDEKSDYRAMFGGGHYNVVRGEKVGYAAGAVLYDEQPTSFAQSWRQRMRWSKGYLQVFRKYASELFSGIARGSFSCYDMTMNIMPAAVLTGLSVVVNIGAAIANATSGGSMAVLAVSVLQTLMSLYLTLFVLGAITTVTEWKNIRCAAWKKVLYAFTFPLFMLTYVPISVAALVGKVEWRPIRHGIASSNSSIES